MQTVIAGYDLFEEAQRAVRSLESHHQSIQDVVVADQKGHGWRKDRAHQRPNDQGVRLHARFLVLMSGEANAVMRARDLLAAQLT